MDGYIDAMYGGAEEWESGEERWAQERPYQPPPGLPIPRADVWGYRDPVTGELHDPRYNGPCALCGLSLSAAAHAAEPQAEPVHTIHVRRHGDRREYFYRVHRACRNPLVELQVEASIHGRTA